MATVVKHRIGKKRSEASEAAPPVKESAPPTPQAKTMLGKPGDPTLKFTTKGRAYIDIQHLEPVLDQYVLDHNLGGRTRRMLQTYLRHFLRLGFTELNEDSLNKYRDLREKEGIAQDTLRGELGKLCSMARWQGASVNLRRPFGVVRAPVAWSREQMIALFNEAHTTERIIFQVPGKLYWPALLYTCYDSAERIGALLCVRWRDFDLAQSILTCPAETRKGRRADKVHRLSPQCVQALEELGRFTAGAANDYVFGRGSGSTLWKSFDNLLADAGLPRDRRRKFHAIRRTSATEVHLSGGDACAHLGHSSDAITRTHYLDPTRAYKPVEVWRPSPPKSGGWLGKLFGK